MKLFHGFPYCARHSPCVLAIGNFDGVHRGHQILLALLKETAKRLHLPAVVLTFNPHPRQYFAHKNGIPAAAPALITPLREKIQALAKCNIDSIVIIRFNNAFANLSASEFIEKILVETLNIRHLVIGENFRFGKNRTGTTDTLKEAGNQYGFTVSIMPSVMDKGIRISSSSIRKALEEGNFDKAAMLLDRPYAISGHIAYGNNIGHKLGFPTANIPLRNYNPVLSGVFVTRVRGLSATPLPAVSMIGTRPSVTTNRSIVLETHILDFTNNCYGTLIQVEFLKKLRNNQKFPDLNTLTAAIRKDTAAARIYFERRQACTKN